MSIEMVRKALLWCTVINYGILLVWFWFFVLAHDWMYLYHGRWLHLSVEQFDMHHYAGMSIFKLGIILLNLVPSTSLVEHENRLTQNLALRLSKTEARSQWFDFSGRKAGGVFLAPRSSASCCHAWIQGDVAG